MNRRAVFATLVLVLVAVFNFTAGARAIRRPAQARDLITGEIDENRRVVLRGNTRPEARPEHDRGKVHDDFPLEHMLLQLRRPPERQRAFDEYVEGLTRGSSPNFHQWLSPVQVGEDYGLSDSDLRRIERWLRSHGFRVNYVYPNRVVMDISATARRLHEAMHVEIHHLEVNGEKHFANVNDPEIPEALASVIVGIASIHDFRPRPMIQPRTQYTYTDAGTGTTYYAVTPPDLAEIYNLNPLFNQGITGKGQTVAMVEDTDPYSTTDWTTFEQEFKLTQYGGTLAITHPNVAGNCSAPGINADDGELALDMEYAAAAAPGAAINVATCANTTPQGVPITTAGIFIAFQNLVASTPHPYIISISYGECEPALGMADNASIAAAYQTAASEGISVFVAAGDQGGASCDGVGSGMGASNGITVSGLASTPYNVAVGGTDFSDTFAGTNGTYWSATNSAVLQSAVGYVPEIPWNSSCASVLVATFIGANPPYGPFGACALLGVGFYSIAAGSGGPSACATGTPSIANQVSGTCAGYPKPAWQTGLFGNPNDGVRDIPDVSLFAASGLWQHFYVFCYTDPTPGLGGAPCTGMPDPTAPTPTWSAAGGTSFAAPILAGIQALVNQRTAALTISPVPGQGNPNPVYYAIAKSEYGGSGNALCDASTQPRPRRGSETTCVFYDVTQGDNDVNCTVSTPNCFDTDATPGNLNGALSTGSITPMPMPPGLLTAGGAGYTSTPTCTISAPHNVGLPGYNGYAGSVRATCTATVAGGVVTMVSLTNPGSGYAPFPICTISGGGGAGATCAVKSITTSDYEPAFPTTPGWDFATGIGTINAYNLVFSQVWAQGP